MNPFVWQPKTFCLVAGIGTCKTELSSFDAALLNAGIGDYNLVRLSSIVPPGCEKLERLELGHLPFGSLLPVAYTVAQTQNRSQRIVSAAAVAIPEDSRKASVIMELSRENTSEKLVLQEVKRMAEMAMMNRDRKIREIVSVSAVSHSRPDGLIGHWTTTIAAAVLI